MRISFWVHHILLTVLKRRDWTRNRVTYVYGMWYIYIFTYFNCTVTCVLCRNKDRGLQRHSVEVTTGAVGYRHIRPNEVNRPKALPVEGAITEESMTSSSNSEAAEMQGQPEAMAAGGRTTVNFLPPALNCMVRLWDEISTEILQVRNITLINPNVSTVSIIFLLWLRYN